MNTYNFKSSKVFFAIKNNDGSYLGLGEKDKDTWYQDAEDACKFYDYDEATELVEDDEQVVGIVT